MDRASQPHAQHLSPSLCLRRLCAPGPQAHEEPGGGPRLYPRVPPQPCLSRALRHSPEGFGDTCPALLTKASPGATEGLQLSLSRGPGCGSWNLQGWPVGLSLCGPPPARALGRRFVLQQQLGTRATDSEWFCWLGLLQALGVARGLVPWPELWCLRIRSSRRGTHMPQTDRPLPPPNCPQSLCVWKLAGDFVVLKCLVAGGAVSDCD